MSAHTPGPWRTTPYSSIVGIAIMSRSGVIAGVRGTAHVAEANARLISSAPDLLALAHKYASECGECGGTRRIQRPDGVPAEMPETVPCWACADIRAVIDKAEGRP